MRTKLLFACLLAGLALWSCSDDKEKENEGPKEFVIGTDKVTLLDGVPSTAYVVVESGNGDYMVVVEDESVVEVVRFKNSDGFTFTPKRIGSTSVTITDLLINKSKVISVTVSEAGIGFVRTGYEIDAGLPWDLRADVDNDLVFDCDFNYLFSNGEKGLLYTLKSGAVNDVRRFEHFKTDGDYYIIIYGSDSNGNGNPDYTRKLKVIYDLPYGDRSYTSFFGFDLMNMTRLNMPQYPEVCYEEDVTEKYVNDYPDITAVKVRYMAQYAFSAFREIE